MKYLPELFWSAPIEAIKRGYVFDEEDELCVCLVCGVSYRKGIIFHIGDQLLEAEMAMRTHINTEHSSMFEYLIGMGKRYTGLTDRQQNILTLLNRGFTDQQIAKELNGVSPSTIRNHRFILREKEKQSRIFLSIMELLQDKSTRESRFINIPRATRAVDERFAITESENKKILDAHFLQGLDGPLNVFPTKQKKKVIVLRHLLKRFDVQREYTEKEVNEILRKAYPDYVTLRRYLIEYGFMDRLRDGSLYWVNV